MVSKRTDTREGIPTARRAMEGRLTAGNASQMQPNRHIASIGGAKFTNLAATVCLRPWSRSGDRKHASATVILPAKPMTTA